MNYSDNAGDVRVDFFHEGGKWYTTVKVNMASYYDDKDIHFAVILATKAEVKDSFKGMTLVCLEPYHKYAHPIMIHKWDQYETWAKGEAA